jgi:hypothetical protein
MNARMWASTADSRDLPGRPQIVEHQRAAVVGAIITALEADNTPLRLPLGDDAVDAVDAVAGQLDGVRTEITARETAAQATACDD